MTGLYAMTGLMSAAEARRMLAGLRLVGEDVIDLALRDEPSTQYGRHDGYLHLVVSGYRPRGDDFELQRVSVTLGEQFMLTIHRGPVCSSTAGFTTTGATSCASRRVRASFSTRSGTT